MADSPPFKPHHSSNKMPPPATISESDSRERLARYQNRVAHQEDEMNRIYDEKENIKTELDDVKTNLNESQRKLVSLQSHLTRSSSETFDKERKYELLEQKLRIQQQKNKDHEKLIGVLQNDRRSQHNSERDLNNQISQLQNELKEAKEDGTQKSADLSVLLVGYDDLGTEKDSEIERLKTRIVELEADHDVSHNMSNQVFLTAANTPNMSLNSSNIINPSKDNTENMEQILMRAENEELKSEIKILKSDLKTQIEIKEREQGMVKTYEKIIDDENTQKISISKKLAEKIAENEDLQSELTKQKTDIKEQLTKIAEFGETAKKLQTEVEQSSMDQAKLKSELHARKVERAEYEAGKIRYEKEISVLKQHKINLTEQLKGFAEEKSELEGKVLELEHGLKLEVEQGLMKVDQYENRYNRVSHELNVAKNENSGISEKNHNLEIEVSELKEQNITIQSDIDDKNEKLDKLRAQYAEDIGKERQTAQNLQAQNSQKQTKIQMLNGQITQATLELSNARKMEARFETKFTTLKERSSILEAQLESSVTENQQLKNSQNHEKTSLDDEILQKTEVIVRLSQENADFVVQVSELVAGIEKLEDDNELLKSKVLESEEKGEQVQIELDEFVKGLHEAKKKHDDEVRKIDAEKISEQNRAKIIELELKSEKDKFERVETDVAKLKKINAKMVEDLTLEKDDYSEKYAQEQLKTECFQQEILRTQTELTDKVNSIRENHLREKAQLEEKLDVLGRDVSELTDLNSEMSEESHQLIKERGVLNDAIENSAKKYAEDVENLETKLESVKKDFQISEHKNLELSVKVKNFEKSDDNLKKKIEKFKANQQTLYTDKQDLVEKLSSRTNEYNIQSEQIHELTERVQASLAETSQVNTRLSEVNLKFEKVKEKLEISENSLKLAELESGVKSKDYAEFFTDFNKIKLESADLSEQVHAKNIEIDGLKNDVENYKRKIESFKNMNDLNETGLKEKIKSLVVQNQELGVKNSTLSNQNQTLEVQNNDLEAQNQELDAQVKDKSDNLTAYTFNFEEQLKKADKQEEDLNAYQTRLNETRHLVTEKSDKIEDLEAKTELLDSEMAALKTKNIELENMFMEESDKAMMQEQEFQLERNTLVNAHKTALASLKCEQDKKETEFHAKSLEFGAQLQQVQVISALEKQELMYEMKNSLAEIQTEKSNLVGIKNDLEMKLTDLNGENSELKMQLKMVQENLVSLTEKIESAEREKSDLENKLHDFKSKCDVNFAELEAEKLKNEKLQSELDTNKLEMQQVATKFDGMIGDVSLLKSELELKSAENANLELVEEMVDQQKQDLTEKDEMITILEEQNRANMQLAKNKLKEIEKMLEVTLDEKRSLQVSLARKEQQMIKKTEELVNSSQIIKLSQNELSNLQGKIRDVNELVVDNKAEIITQKMCDKALISLKEEHIDQIVSEFTKTSKVLQTDCEFLIGKLASVKDERNGLKKNLSDKEAECKGLLMKLDEQESDLKRMENKFDVLTKKIQEKARQAVADSPMPPPRPSRNPVSKSDLGPFQKSTPNHVNKTRPSIARGDVQMVESCLNQSKDDLKLKSRNSHSKSRESRSSLRESDSKESEKFSSEKFSSEKFSSEKFSKPAIPRYLSQGSHHSAAFDAQSMASSIQSGTGSVMSVGGNSSLVHDEDDMVHSGFGTLAQRFSKRSSEAKAPDFYHSPNSARINELTERNKLAKPHLKCSYPLEVQGRSPDRMNTYADRSQEPSSPSKKRPLSQYNDHSKTPDAKKVLTSKHSIVTSKTAKNRSSVRSRTDSLGSNKENENQIQLLHQQTVERGGSQTLPQKPVKKAEAFEIALSPPPAMPSNLKVPTPSTTSQNSQNSMKKKKGFFSNFGKKKSNI